MHRRYVLLRSSIHTRLSQLTVSGPHACGRILVLGRHFSSCAKSIRLRHSTRRVHPFFTRLSGHPTYQNGGRRVLSTCHGILTRALGGKVRKGNSLGGFVRERSTTFQTFLSKLRRLNRTGVTSVAHSARGYYSRIFFTTKHGRVACGSTAVCVTLHASHQLVRGIHTYLSGVHHKGIMAPRRTRTCI